MPVYTVTVREIRVFRQIIVAGDAQEALSDTVDLALTGQISAVRTSIDTLNCDVTEITNNACLKHSSELPATNLLGVWRREPPPATMRPLTLVTEDVAVVMHSGNCTSPSGD